MQAGDDNMADITANMEAQVRAPERPSTRTFGLAAKRLFDIAASVCGLAVFSPLLVLAAYLIRRESPGPALYRGPRAGKDGKVFGILKFRTMYERPETYTGARVTGRDDERVTPLGRWLRATKVNELPQLWNVLAGEMSMVGPRPEDPEIVNAWPESVRREVLSVRPGITSPASVIYKDEEKLLTSVNVMDEYLRDLLPNKLRLDQLYVRNHSFLSDLDLLFSTLVALVPGLRRVPVPTESLYHGWLYHFAHRYFSWFVVDSLTAFAAVTLAGVLRRLEGPLDIGVDKLVVTAAGLALTFSLVNTLLGLGRVSWRHAAPSYGLSLAFSSLMSTTLLITVDLVWPNRRFIPLGVLPMAGVLAWMGFMAVRYRERLLTGVAAQWLWLRHDGKDGLGEHVLIVGAGECGQLANWLLDRSKLSRAFSIIGLVDDDPSKHGMTVDGHRVHGLTRRIPDLVKQHDVRVILFAIENIDQEERARILGLCRQTAARVVMVPDIMGLFRERMRQPGGAAA